MLLNNISLKNIYYLVLYAFQNLTARNLELVEKQDYETIHDLCAVIFIHGITAQVKRGFHREYIKNEGVFPTVSGQINVAETIKQQTLILGKIVCSYEDFHSNSLPNQALKSIIMLLIKQGKIKPKNKESLRKLLLYFNDTKLISPLLVQWNMIKTHRANKTYQLLLGVCKLITDGLVYTNENGLPCLSDAIRNGELLARIYEKAILSYYIKHHLKYYPKAVNITIEGGMVFDIFMQKQSKFVFIDTKYYRKIIPIDNIRNFQIKTKNVSQVIHAFLLYPKVDDTESITGVNISLKTLDMKLTWNEIKTILDNNLELLNSIDI